MRVTILILFLLFILLQYRPSDYIDTKQRNYFVQQVELYASAIQKIFLQAFYIEQDRVDTIHTAFHSTQSTMN